MKKLTARQPAQKAQRGGTLLGLVIGVVVGLLLALALAVYVTRVPIPFVDRGVSRKPVQDEQEAERNKGWNPNAGLGQSSPLPQATAPATAPGASDADADAGDAAATADPAEAADAPKASEPDSDPLGDLVKAQTTAPAARPSPPAPEVPSGADGAAYFIQAGAYRDPAEAEAQRARLALLGVSSRVSTSNSPDGTSVLRVRSGPYPQKFMADAVKEKLDANGMESALVRVQR